MRRRMLFGYLFSVVMLTFAARRADAQAMLADEIVILSKGQTEQEKSRTNTHLGTAPGAGGSRLRSPGAAESRLGEPAPRAGSAARADILSAASGYERGRLWQPAPPAIAPAGRAEIHPVPLYGRLELPSGDDEGPPDGLTLDMAIERLVRTNTGLRTSFRRFRTPRPTSSRPVCGPIRSSSRAPETCPTAATQLRGPARTTMT